MMAGLALVLMFMGFVAIAASMSRHQQQLGTGSLPPARRLRWRLAGYALLAVSLAPCFMGWKPSIALALWCGLMTPAAFTLGLLLTYAPGWARRLNVLAVLDRDG